MRWEWKVNTRELDKRLLRWARKQRCLLVFQDVAAQEKALLSAQLYPFDPAFVCGVFRLRKRGNIVGNV